ncbi:MAG: DUF4349 domain-containing protein [Gemmatimonadaceae bacterium]
MKAPISFLALALASFAFGCEKSGTSAADAVSGKTQGLAAGAPARDLGMSGKVVGVGSSQLSDAPAPMAIANEASPDAPPNAPNPLQSIYPGPGSAAMVIRTGEAFIEVDKVDPAVLKIRQLAAQVGGYIANSSISGGQDQIRQATVELKVPSTKYDQAVGSLSTIGKVESVNSTAQDVGEEFVDVTARVNNSRRLEERLINLLANRTGKLDEVLRVERELARVREEIERYEGRLRYLSTRVATSTLTITVHEPAPILGNNPGENPIAAAFRRAWKNFVGVVAASIAALGVLIPLAILVLLGWLGYRRWLRRSR